MLGKKIFYKMYKVKVDGPGDKYEWVADEKRDGGQNAELNKAYAEKHAALEQVALDHEWVTDGKRDGGLNAELKKAYVEKQALLDEKKHLEDQIAEEKDRYVRRLAALEQVKIELTKEREANAKTIEDKEGFLRELVAKISSCHNDIASNHTDSEKFRKESKDAVAERQKTLEQVVLINDCLLNTVVERLRLEKLERELRAQLLRMPSVPNHN